MSVSSRMCPQDSDIVTVKTTSGNTQITVGALRTLINAAGYNTAILINNYGGSEYVLIWFQTVAEDLYLADDQTFLGLSRNYPILGIKPNGSYSYNVNTTYRLKNDLSGFEDFQYVSWNIGRSKQVDGVYYTIIDDNARSTESFPAICVSSYDGNIYCNGEPYVPPVQTYTSNGGGATHIAKVTGQLKDLSSNLSDILIVSGGGGGGLLVGETEYAGADAGGISGSGDNSADQSTGNAFGQGESGTNVSGGGSGLYGGYKGTSSKSGGAGSGYIGNPLLSNKKMVGYNVPTSSAESTKTESVNEASETPVANKPKIGNGFARIKFLREPSVSVNIDIKAANQLKYNNVSPTFRIGSMGSYDSESQSYFFSQDADMTYNNLSIAKQAFISATQLSFECEAKVMSTAYGSYADVEFYFHGIEDGGDLIECVVSNGNSESGPKIALNNGGNQWGGNAPLDMSGYRGAFHKVKYILSMNNGKVLRAELYIDDVLIGDNDFNIDLNFRSNNNYTAFFGATDNSYIKNYKITIIGGV